MLLYIFCVQIIQQQVMRGIGLNVHGIKIFAGLNVHGIKVCAGLNGLSIQVPWPERLDHLGEFRPERPLA